MTKRLLAALAVLVALATVADASSFAFEQITVDNTSGGVTFTAAKITPTTGTPLMTFADCTLETAQIRILTVDPAVTAVTSAVGQVLNPGDHLYIFTREELLNFRAIRTTSTSALLSCKYKDRP